MEHSPSTEADSTSSGQECPRLSSKLNVRTVFTTDRQQSLRWARWIHSTSSQIVSLRSIYTEYRRSWEADKWSATQEITHPTSLFIPNSNKYSVNLKMSQPELTDVNNKAFCRTFVRYLYSAHRKCTTYNGTSYYKVPWDSSTYPS
jgi:hypothetical protein